MLFEIGKELEKIIIRENFSFKIVSSFDLDEQRIEEYYMMEKLHAAKNLKFVIKYGYIRVYNGTQARQLWIEAVRNLKLPKWLSRSQKLEIKDLFLDVQATFIYFHDIVDSLAKNIYDEITAKFGIIPILSYDQYREIKTKIGFSRILRMLFYFSIVFLSYFLFMFSIFTILKSSLDIVFKLILLLPLVVAIIGIIYYTASKMPSHMLHYKYQ